MYPAVNGQSNRSNTFLLDGVYNTGNYQGSYAVAPSIDMLDEFKVQSHSDEAQFGAVMGRIVNIASKSGTNQFLRNPYLSNPTPQAWFNTKAFAPPKSNTFGSAGRNILRTDGLQNVDFSLFRARSSDRTHRHAVSC